MLYSLKNINKSSEFIREYSLCLYIFQISLKLIAPQKFLMGVIKRYGSYFCIIKLDFNLHLISFISTEARFASFLHILRIVY